MRRLREGIFLVISLVIFNNAFAESKQFGFETFSLRTGVVVPKIPLELRSTNTATASADSIKYEQNTAGKLGVGFDWGWIGAYTSVLNLDPKRPVADYGTSEYTDFQFHLFFSHLGFDAYFQDFKGYYLQNTESLLPAYSAANGVLLRPDIESFNSGLNFIYILRPERMSFAAAINNSQTFTQDGGSWMLLLSANWQKLKSDAVLAPASLEASYGKLGNMHSGEFSTLTMGTGYGYTWYFKSPLYIHTSLILSGGPQWQHFITQLSGIESAQHPSIKAVARLAAGYNGERIFSGLVFQGDNTTVKIEDRSLSFVSLQISAYAGIRL